MTERKPNKLSDGEVPMEWKLNYVLGLQAAATKTQRYVKILGNHYRK